MRTVLYINDSICSSLEQLRNIFAEVLVPATPLYEDILTLQRDGEFARWLSEGDSEDEKRLSKMLNDLPIDISNSELVNSLKQFFVGDAQEILKPHFSNYIELQQIRCMANDSEVELIYEPTKYNILLKNHPHYSKQYKEGKTLKVYEGYVRRQSNKECWTKLFLDFKIIKTDDEELVIYFHGTHILPLKGKSVGQIVTIESNPYMFETNHAFDLTIEKEKIGIVILNDAEWKVKIGEVEIEMVHVEGGTFTMGAAKNQARVAESDEFPTHEVSLSSFNIGKFEVTQKQWEEVMGKNPSCLSYDGEMRPVEYVSWEDCQVFIERLNTLTGKNFRLPTEAEWEYAARGGKYSKGYKYAGSDNIEKVAWFDGAFEDSYNGQKTLPVGQLVPNELGLYDMSGNVYEWCQDVYGEYCDDFQKDPTGPIQGEKRVFRGGSFINTKKECRTSYRNYDKESYKQPILGLRLAL